MFKKLLLLVLLALTTYSSYSDGAWNNLKLPATLTSNITSFASWGNDFYLGTNGQGVFYSNDSGNTWTNNSISVMLPDSFPKILINSTGKAYAFGKSMIYFTSDKGNSWQAMANYPGTKETIQCEDISSSDYLVVGTNQSIYVYSQNADGWFWYRTNSQMGPMNCFSIAFDMNGQIFVSCFHRESYKIFLTDLNGQLFTEIEKNITENPPLVSCFSHDSTGIMYAAVGSSIYQFDFASALWTLFTQSDQKQIKRIKFASIYLLSFDDSSLRIFDTGKKSWIPDNPGLHFTDPVIDVNIDNGGGIAVIHNKGIDIGIGNIGSIIGIILSNYFIVQNDLGTPMAHKTFKLYKASCDNNQVFLENVTTNNQGGFYLNYQYFSLNNGDQIKLEMLVYTKYAVKTGHEDFGGKMYDLYLNNMEFDGMGNPHYYSLTDQSQQTITMGHTMIHRFLVVSVEWEAKREYLDTLASWCKLMSNFLYDVTDGQLYVEGVAIYDNFQKWDQADIRVFANNLVWPNSAVAGINQPDADQAQVRMPRRWWGNSDDTRNYDEKSWWYTYNDRDVDLFMSSTIAHELGHYMLGFYDEYVWTDTSKAKYLPDGYNMGFMQYQYQNAPDWSSEMSDPDRYSNPDYRYTAQWTYNGSDCWTQFRNTYQGYYEDYASGGDQLWVPIKMPTDRVLSSGMNFMRGPMDYLTGQNQCSMIPTMTVNVHDVNLGYGDYNFIVWDQNDNPIAKADIYDYAPLFSTYIKKDYQGESADDGNMIVVGAAVNDEILIMAQKMFNLGFIQVPYYYFYTVIVNAVTGAKNQGDNTQDVQVIHLTPLKMNNRIVPTMKYDFSGNVSLDFYTLNSFNTNPTIDFPLTDSSTKNYNLNYNQQKSDYSIGTSDGASEQGTIMFNSTDSANKQFSIPFNYQISNFGRNVFAPGGAGELILDTNNTSIERISALSSNFFPLLNGLDKNVKQAGSVVSFSTSPGTLEQGTKNMVNIRYSRSNLTLADEASLSIFKWDESNLKWNQITSTLDTANRVVSAMVSSDGTYGSFTTSSASGVLDNNDNNYFSFGAYPNPFTSSSKLEFYLSQAGNVTVSMYDALGNKIATYADSYLGSGKHSYDIDGKDLSSGVYYVILKAENQVITKKVVLLK